MKACFEVIWVNSSSINTKRLPADAEVVPEMFSLVYKHHKSVRKTIIFGVQIERNKLNICTYSRDVETLKY